MDPVILIFAGIAAFFIFKLLSALGENSGESDGQSDARKEIEALRRTLSGNAASREGIEGDTPDTSTGADAGMAIDNARDERPAPVRAISPAAQTLQEADPHFDERSFLDGAKGAYEMIVNAFARDDVSGISQFLSNNVAGAFKGAIASRTSAGHAMDVKFVGIEKAEIVNATVRDDALVAVTDFTSNQVRVTRDADGNVVEGDPVRIELVKDRWTFERKRSSRDPNWILVATGSAA
ncbi:MAG: Tim44/TimA family putative adaptor protein [Pseudomonadota bacterium]